MLSTKSIQAADALTANILDNGYVTWARADTYLATLINSMASTGNMRLVGDSTEAENNAIRTASMPLNPTIQDMHSAEMAEMATMVAGRISNIVSYTKNHINPVVLRILEKAEVVNSEIMNSGGVTTTIIPLRLHSTYSEATLDQILSSARATTKYGKAIPQGDLNKLTNSLTSDEFISILKTTSEYFNKQLFKILEDSYPGDTVRSLNVNAQENVARGPVEIFSKHDDLLSLLFLRGIYQGRHPSISYSDLSSEAQTAVQSLIHFWGGRVINKMEQAGSYISDGKVVITTRPEEDIIYVNDTNYRSWLTKGGSSDSLIGAWLSKGRGVIPPTDMVLTNIKRFESIYTKQNQSSDTTSRIEANSAIGKLVFHEVIDAITDLDTAIENKGAMKKDLNRIYQEHNITTFSNPDSYIRFMVCSTIGKGSDSLAVLTDMENYMKDNEDASPEEAAVEAISIRLAVFLANMIVVTPKSETPEVEVY